LKKKLVTLATASITLLASCKKEVVIEPPPRIIAEMCMAPMINPSGRSYSSDSLISFDCTASFCGLMPLNSKNYWVYEDSIFNNGVFVRVQYDTLRYSRTWRSIQDGLVWWQGSFDIGLPLKLFASDSALFRIDNRLFTPGILDVKKDYGMFEGDSLRYLASFEDIAAQGRSVKLNTAITTWAGIFTNIVLFEKNARSYRRDQVYFKPGFGVIRYIQERAPMGSPILKLQKICTLVDFHIE